ncbi:unnamed protein product [Parnassius apollo]|uniref:(apollo) hypothetical protein n=1 Tax=Parnassius apollo TaxID=110799 RepID=A0A8S3XYT1_PARAO|nr:unnamed protein product [Parnassius apollo]
MKKGLINLNITKRWISYIKDDTNDKKILSRSDIIEKDRLATFKEKFQPLEQAGFRKNFSTIDHIHNLNLIIEKYIEHNRPLYLACIDYAKAFDSISHTSMYKALHECEAPTKTIDLIKDIYYKSKSRVKLERHGPEINICRGVRQGQVKIQGDPLSPRIFITVLQNIMKTLNWEKTGINVNSKLLSNLRFSDDIMLFSREDQEIRY